MIKWKPGFVCRVSKRQEVSGMSGSGKVCFPLSFMAGTTTNRKTTLHTIEPLLTKSNISLLEPWLLYNELI